MVRIQPQPPSIGPDPRYIPQATPASAPANQVSPFPVAQPIIPPATTIYALTTPKSITGTRTSGQAAIDSVVKLLKSLPAVMQPLLHDEKFLFWVSTPPNPEVLSQVANGSLSALEQLEAHLPHGKLKIAVEGIIAILHRVNAGVSFVLGKNTQKVGDALDPYRGFMQWLRDVLVDPTLVAVLGFLREIRFPISRALNDLKNNATVGADVNTGKLPDILANIEDKTLDGAGLKALLIYLYSDHHEFYIDPKSESFKKIVEAIPDLKNLDLTVVDQIKVEENAKLTLKLSEATLALLKPISANTNSAPKTKGQELVEEMRWALNTMPPAMNELMTNSEFVSKLIANPRWFLGLANTDLITISKIQEQMPDGTNMKRLLGMVFSFRHLLGDEAATSILAPLLEPLKSKFEALYRAVTTPEIVTVIRFAQSVNLPIDKLLHDLKLGKAGDLDPDLLAHIVDHQVSSRDVWALFLYVENYTGGQFTIDPKSPSFITLLGYISGKNNLDLSKIANILIGPQHHIKINFKPDITKAFKPSPAKYTSGEIHSGSDGITIVNNLRIALDTLPPMFQPLLKNTKFINWLADNVSLLPQIEAVNLAALAQFQANMPACELKDLLGLALALEPVLGPDATKQALLPYIAPVRPMLDSLHVALTNDVLRANIQFANDIHLPIATLLGDLVIGTKSHGVVLDPDMVARLVDKKMTKDDVLALFAYLRSRSPNHTFDIVPSAPYFPIMLASFPRLANNPKLSAVTRITIGPGPVPVFHYSAETISLFQPTAPSATKDDPPPPPGTTDIIFALRRALDTQPPVFKRLLENSKFVTDLIHEKSTFLLDLADLKLAAIAHFQYLLTQAKIQPIPEIKPLLDMALEVPNVMGNEATLAAIRPLITPVQPILRALGTALADPQISATLQVASGAGLSLTTLLKDVLAAKAPLTVGLLERLAKGETTADDVTSLMIYLRDQTHGKFSINKDTKTWPLLSSLFPIPSGAHLAGLKKLTINNGAIHLEMKSGHEAVAEWGPFSFSPGAQFTGTLKLTSPAKPGTPALEVKANFGTVIRLIFAGTQFHTTGNESLDTFLNIVLIFLKALLSPLLLLMGLLGEAAGTSMKLVDIDHHKHLQIHAFWFNLVDEPAKVPSQKPFLSSNLPV